MWPTWLATASLSVPGTLGEQGHLCISPGDGKSIKTMQNLWPKSSSKENRVTVKTTGIYAQPTGSQSSVGQSQAFSKM